VQYIIYESVLDQRPQNKFKQLQSRNFLTAVNVIRNLLAYIRLYKQILGILIVIWCIRLAPHFVPNNNTKFQTKYNGKVSIKILFSILKDREIFGIGAHRQWTTWVCDIFGVFCFRIMLSCCRSFVVPVWFHKSNNSLNNSYILYVTNLTKYAIAKIA